MAAATDPSKALDSTPEKTNFQRAARLLICGGTITLREIFDKIHPPKDLPTILNDPAIKSQLAAARITKPQWDCLYPSPGTYGKSEDFDVTLLFKLLRTICNLHPPASGWDDLPASTDHSLAADLARIKYYRNTVYGHVNQRMEIRNEEFQLLWQEIREALLRIARSISSTKGTEWEDAIDKLLNDPLTAEDDRNVKELLHWYRNDIEIKELVVKLNSSIQDIQSTIEEKGKTLETTFQEEAQGIKNQLEEELKTTRKDAQCVRQEVQNIKDQLGDEVKTTTEEVQFLRRELREEAKDIKDQLGGEMKAATEEVQSLREEFQEEAKDIKDQLGGEVKAATKEAVTSLRQEVREEVQNIKEQLGEEAQNIKDQLGEEAQNIKDQLDKLKVSSEVHQASGVQLQMRIDCKTIKESPVPGASGLMVLTSEGSDIERKTVVGVKHNEMAPTASSLQQENGSTRGSEAMRIGSDCLPSSEEVLNFIALKYFKEVDASSPHERNEFLQYLRDVRKLLLVDIKIGSIIITVECSSLQVLDELWDDHYTGHLNEMAQKHLVTEEILNKFGLVEVQLSTTIREEEYRAAQEYFMKCSVNDAKPRGTTLPYGKEHVDVADAHSSLSPTKPKFLGDFQQVQEPYERPLDSQLKILGPGHVDVAIAHHSLGKVHIDLRDLQQAKDHYERALDIQLKKLGPTHVDVARTYHSLGNVNLNLGNLQQAIIDYARSLNIRQRMFGIEDIHVALSCHNMGVVYQQLGDLQQAQECFETALQIRLKKLGPNHSDVALSYHTLGVARHQLGDLRKAKEYYKRALNIASMLENQGNAYLNVGDLQFAKEHYERSLTIRLRTLRLLRKRGFLQVAVARTYHSLGNVNLSLGNLRQAITDYARALDIRQRMFGIEDIHVALSCHNMGVVYQQLGDLQQAQECFEIALQIRLKKLEPNHDDVTRSYHTLSVLHHQLGDLRKATEYRKRAVHIELKKL